MSSYEIYILILCLIVYVLLTTLSIIVVVTLVKMMLKMIRHGLEDDKIKEESKKQKKKCTAFDKILSTVVCLFFAVVFIFSTYVNCQENSTFDNIPTLKVVNSASMATKHADNEYLITNNLNDQFQTFDLILTYKLPAEEDLKLYDIVVYEVDDILVIHRIVGIEEPNDKHSDRYFLLQGDAIERPDRFPVYYSQMRAIYRGERVPFVGSFITFLQSPAGWLCIILMVFTMFALPIVEKKVQKEIDARLLIIEGAEEGDDNPSQVKEILAKVEDNVKKEGERNEN